MSEASIFLKKLRHVWLLGSYISMSVQYMCQRIRLDKLPLFQVHLIFLHLLVKMSQVMRKPVYAICDNKGADQPAHPCSLISTFVVPCLDSIIPLVSISKILSLYMYPASVAVQAGFSLPWSQITKTGFLMTRLNNLSDHSSSFMTAAVCGVRPFCTKTKIWRG